MPEREDQRAGSCNVRIILLSDRIPPESVGGAGKAAWSLACGLRDAGHQVHVVAATTEEPFEEVREAIPTYHLRSQYPTSLRAWLSLYNPQTILPLRRVFARIHPDVVNAHNVHRDLSYHSLTIARRLGLPVVYTAHDVMPFAYAKLTHFIDPSRCGVDSPEQYRLPRFHNLKQMRFYFNPFRNHLITRTINRDVHERVCVSEVLRQALEANRLREFSVVHNGLDPTTFEVPERVIDELRRRLGLVGRRVVLFGGRPSKAKGFKQLLQALDRVVQRVPSVTLLVLFPRPLSEMSIDFTSFPHLRSEHKREAGWLSGDELVGAFHLADVVTVPSTCLDSFGMMNLEAMAAGKPAVSTCYGGSPEVIIDGQTGYIINPFDTATFANRLARLLTDHELQRRMGETARRRLLEQFTAATQARRMLAIYERAIERTAKKSGPSKTTLVG